VGLPGLTLKGGRGCICTLTPSSDCRAVRAGALDRGSSFVEGGRIGSDYAHAIVDDHSRLAFVEPHEDDKAATVTGFVERALAFFASTGSSQSG
jgi:hypothetical protein